MIEAIPNVSEGRNVTVITRLEDTLRTVPRLNFLGAAPDPDHNRTVISYATPDAETMRIATLALFREALDCIDLRTHRGEHPRIGAIDVMPFVPLGKTEMQTCVELAKRVAAEVAAEFDLPVFLYEYAASADYRRALPSIRSGGPAKLEEKMKMPEWRPDYGPTTPHPSGGVSVIGARRPLIAFNVQLATDDLDVADQVARAVREVSGGLPAVRALPIRLAARGIVQVSMNLLDYKRTSILEAFDAVRREAEARGVEVLSSELVGLAPAEALSEPVAQAISLENFSMNLVLENRIGWGDGERSAFRD